MSEHPTVVVDQALARLQGDPLFTFAGRNVVTRVLSVVRRIPPGRVATYGDVAAMAGRPRAARAVGNIMKGVGRPDIPAHRVIAAGGLLAVWARQ